MNTRQNLRRLAWSLLRQAKALKKNGQFDLAQRLARRSLSIRSLAWSHQPQLVPINVRTTQSLSPRK